MVSDMDGYDKKPVIKTLASGQQFAGFMNLHTNEFEEIMEIRDTKDLDKFLETYEISIVEVIKA